MSLSSYGLQLLIGQESNSNLISRVSHHDTINSNLPVAHMAEGHISNREKEQRIQRDGHSNQKIHVHHLALIGSITGYTTTWSHTLW